MSALFSLGPKICSVSALVVFSAGTDLCANLFTQSCRTGFEATCVIHKVCIFHGTSFPEHFGLSTTSFQEFQLRNAVHRLLSYKHPSHGCEVWHGCSIIAPGSDLEFYFINILFCKDLEGRGFGPTLVTSTFGLFLPFLSLFATLTRVFCILKAGMCAVHGNKSMTISEGIYSL